MRSRIGVDAAARQEDLRCLDVAARKYGRRTREGTVTAHFYESLDVAVLAAGRWVSAQWDGCGRLCKPWLPRRDLLEFTDRAAPGQSTSHRCATGVDPQLVNDRWHTASMEPGDLIASRPTWCIAVSLRSVRPPPSPGPQDSGCSGTPIMQSRQVADPGDARQEVVGATAGGDEAGESLQDRWSFWPWY